MTTDNLTWIAARASGMLGYALVTISVAFGVALSLKVRTTGWPRYVTTEVHRRITLVALAFTAVHGVTLWLDPFQAFSPIEVVVPLASHYRPLWVALGIIAGDLMLALWLSERIQRRIGYAWWRRLHYLTFIAWILVTIHGLGTGSDSRAPWAIGLYAGGTILVAGLILLRVWPVVTARQTAVMGLTAAGIWMLGVWTVTGPLQTGWNEIANNGNGSGQVNTADAGPIAPTAASTEREGTEGSEGSEDEDRRTPAATAPPVGGAIPATFQATFTGQLRQSAQTDGSWLVSIDGALQGGLSGRLTIDATETSGGAIVGSRLQLTTSAGIACSGSLIESERGRLQAGCATADGQRVSLRLVLSSQSDGSVIGSVSAGRQGR